MARKCFMCGREISSGILCEKCDPPRRSKAQAAAETQRAPEPAAAPKRTTPPPAAQQVRHPEPSPSSPQQSAPPSSSPETSAAHALDAFPEAPVLKFPVEAASPAITSVVNLLVAAGVPSILLGSDRGVKFVSDEARKVFDAPQSDLTSLRYIEEQAGLRVNELSLPASAGVRIRNRNYIYSLVPMSGGATGAVMIFRPADPMNESHASFITYVVETVFGPMRALRDSLLAAANSRSGDPVLSDAAATVEQVLSSLELAPGVESAQIARPVPTVTEVVQRVADRFVPFADLKRITLQVDVQELEERFSDHEHLADSLSILMENALHYVPGGGQVVIGVRWMEHKGKPLLLFFVMDNGALVPEHLRLTIFEPSFAWSPSAAERTGRGLFKVREFAVGHGGSVWVESRTGKACTFFLRIRPDEVR